MAGTPEDKRTAAGLVVALSSYLISATLAVLGAQAAIITFVIDKREGLRLFGIVAFVGWLALMLSMFVGGKGIAEIYKAGFDGEWKVTTSGKKFVIQTALAFLGVGLVFGSIFIGRPKPDGSSEIERLMSAVNQRCDRLERQLERSQEEIANLQRRIAAAEQIRTERGRP